MASTVIYGVDQESGNLAGMTVAEVRIAYQQQFNIPTDAVAFVNGSRVENENKYVVKEGDKVTFDRTSDRGTN
jgi:CYTH domain-containing protein